MKIKIKELTKDQKWLYQQIMKLGKNKKVTKMSYEDLFETLDRVKFCYFLDACFLDDKTKEKLKKMLEDNE